MSAFRHLLILAIAAVGPACTQNEMQRPGGDAVNSEGKMATGETVQLEFLDSRIFDEELSSAMRDKRTVVTVTLPVGFHLNDIPERFDPWFYAIKEAGGTVVAKPKNPPRGIVSAVIDVVVAIIERIDEARLYGPSENYDATLLYREDGIVDTVVFSRRES